METESSRGLNVESLNCRYKNIINEVLMELYDVEDKPKLLIQVPINRSCRESYYFFYMGISEGQSDSCIFSYLFDNQFNVVLGSENYKYNGIEITYNKIRQLLTFTFFLDGTNNVQFQLLMEKENMIDIIANLINTYDEMSIL